MLASQTRALSLLALLALLAPPAGARAGEPSLVGPFPKDEYPQAVIDRPLTLPAGMVEGEIGGRFTSLLQEPVLGVGGTDDWDADVALRVGVTDRFQIEAGTSFSLDHSLREVGRFNGLSAVDARPSLTSWQRVVPLRLSLLALDTETLDTAVTLTLPFVAQASRTFRFFEGRGASETVVSKNSDGRVLPEVDLAAPTRWRLCDWLWLRAGENLLRVTTGRGVAQFAFDLGVGIQPHRLFAVTLDSRIATVTLDGDGERGSFTLADVGRLDLEAVLAPLRWLDLVGDVLLPDVGDGVDVYVLRLAVRVRV